MESSGSTTNKLGKENSLYLRQHAHNPVNWQPWGDEALHEAVSENKLIIISVGYAACHWCHVMEKESFTDNEVARIMNEHFINIKVDREERPDVDAFYMDACHLSGGGNCGWPLNAFALPDGRPFWAGTYFPKNSWINVLRQFIHYSKNEKGRLVESAEAILNGIRQTETLYSATSAIALDKVQIQNVTTKLIGLMDPVEGGRLGQPKFPLPNKLDYLLQFGRIYDDEESSSIAHLSLKKMALGGIYDQLGGGFSRYSVDNKWFVPHFEKMLYDNGQLISSYSIAYLSVKEDLYKDAIKESIEFLKREMLSPENGFYTALDADSEGIEGKFYTWTNEEIKTILQQSIEFELFSSTYNTTEQGNWEEGKNILYRSTHDSYLSQEKKSALDAAKKKLYDEREKRIRPQTDTKILTSWNALVLVGLLDAYKALKNESYLDLAIKNIDFLTEKMMESNFKLFRSYNEGSRKINGFLDDYAHLIQALISIFQITSKNNYLELAKGLTKYTLEFFFDEKITKFYYSSKEDKQLLLRKSEITDNVIPSSSSVMAKNLFLLGQILTNNDYLAIVRKLSDQVMTQASTSNDPGFYSNWLSLFLMQIEGVHQVVITGPQAFQYRDRLLGYYLPNSIILASESESPLELFSNRFVEGKTLIWICRDNVCKLPVEHVEEALKILT